MTIEHLSRRVTSPIQGASDVDAAAASVDSGAPSPVPLRPPPAPVVITGDAIDQLAVLLEKFDQESRSASRASERAEYDARAKEDAAQVAAMHQKADELRAEGMATGLMQIGAGVAEVGSAVATFGASNAEAAASETRGALANGATKEAMRAGVDAIRKDVATAAQDRLLAAALSGSAKGLSAGATMAGGIYRGREADLDATAKAHASAADAHDRAAKLAHDDANDARDALNKVLEWVKETRASQSGAQLTAAGVLRG